MSGTFDVDIQRFVTKAKGNIDLVHRKVAIDLFRRVIMKSPVDLGTFKSNWQCAIGSIPSGVLNTVDKSGTATIARMSAVAATFKVGQVIYLVNNLAYARPLEYGHSKQAPGGMVRLSVAEFGAVIRKAASEVPK